MSEVVMETQCTSCSHREVCSFKDEYLLVQKEASNMRISREDEYDRHAIIPVSNFKWLKPIKVECRHYSIVQPIQRTNTLSTPDTAVYDPYKYAIKCDADLDVRLRGVE